MTLRARAEGAAGGVLAAFAGVGTAEGVATAIAGPSPVVAVGTWAIDTSPAWLREWAIRTFGVDDKQVLVAGMLATIALLAAVAGAVGVTRRALAVGMSIGVGLVGVLAVATFRGVDDPALVRVTPALVALIVSTGGLILLLGALDRAEAGETPPVEPASVGLGARVTPRAPVVAVDEPQRPAVMIPTRRPLALAAGLDRRTFLTAAGGVAAVGVAGGALWKFGEESYATSGLFALPRPASPAPPVRRADFSIPGLTPYFTPNDDFYRIDTALVVPRLSHETWKLTITGMVDRPVTLTFDDLLTAPLIERDVTLMCVSNEVGGYYNGTARWLGVRVADVLASVGIRPEAEAVKSTSADGWTCGTPLSALTDPSRDAMFAIGMNGQPLPVDHGFPVRMVVPGLYGFVSATKWLTKFEVTRFDEFEAYWTSRGWSEQAPVKTQSRIELPTPYSDVAAGSTQLAGMAWAVHRGVRKVEVLIDGEPYVAELAPWDNPDTWRQWRLRGWEATPGDHTIAVRATDASGEVQTAKRARPDPDGATGWHTVRLTVPDSAR
ncbi:molybdopterin-dependent oxidoreductase [Sporichthya polymorpha]|uniref:molybdopterin-dependent oxidoreductase n=1 Tax=Sporichthya polymorpha TaxID=35751 RepID=UPI000374645E|nr:molybdopterin-dependent oxidoreductase [Sporichthya polymorpha]